MNYVWAFLILFSFGAALFTDFRDLQNDRWENNRTWTATVVSETDWTQSGRIRIFFEGSADTAEARYSKAPGAYLSFSEKQGLPERLAERLSLQKEKSADLRTSSLRVENSRIHFAMPPVRWVKMNALSDAAFDMAKTAVTLALGLIGAMALWLGLMRIAEESGMISVVVQLVKPVLKPLFPDIPADSPAFGAISLNLAANVLGLGNAATPLGIKAMEELKKLTPDSDEASHAMCMFLAINTSSVQLLPPVTLVALMGTGVAPLMVSITLATICSTAAAIVLAQFFRKRSLRHG